MKRRTDRIAIVVEEVEPGRWVARVSPLSYGPFPAGTRPLPYGGATFQEASDGLKAYVRVLLRGSRVVFEGGA